MRIWAKEQTWTSLFWGLWGVAVVVVLATFMTYGVTWDEIFMIQQGEVFRNWYASGFHDRGFLESDHRFYGAFFPLLIYFFDALLPLSFYNSQHLLVSLFGLSIVVLAYYLGKELKDAKAGFFAALFLLLTPRFYGEIFINPKDIVFAAVFFLAFFWVIKTNVNEKTFSKKTILIPAFFISLALGVRIGGVLLLFYLALYWLVFNAPKKKKRIKAAGAVLLVSVLAFIFSLPWWPYLQLSPIHHFFEVFQAVMDWKPPFSIFFREKFYMHFNLPQSYLPVWFLIALPEFYFGALLVGLAGLKKRKKKTSFSKPKLAMVALAFVFPVLVVVATRADLFDGFRHMLFVVPFLAVLAGVSFSLFLDSSLSKEIKILVCGVGLFSLGATLVTMVQLHPYQYIYFNRLFGGGLATASQRFDLEYHGLANKEAFEWVKQNATPLKNRPLRVANCTVRHLFDTYITEDLKTRFEPVMADQNPDVMLATTRWNCHTYFKTGLVHVVTRLNTPLMYVYALTEEGWKSLAPAEPS